MADKTKLHILTMECSINGSPFFFLLRDDEVCGEAAEMFPVYRTG